MQRKLSQLRGWSEQMHSCEPTFVTSNRLFAVTCAYFHHSVLPQLNYICQRTHESVSGQLAADAQQFNSELQCSIQVLTITTSFCLTAFSSSTTWVNWHQKGKPFWILVKQEMMGWQWHQLDHKQIICTSFQTDKHESISSVSFTGRIPFLPPNQQHQSTEGTSDIDIKLNIKY